MRKLYLDGPFGQLHVRHWPGPSEGSARPLVGLHPLPYAGRYMAGLAEVLAADRPVWLPDWPGYGASDAPLEAPDLHGYAAALAPVLEHIGEPVDLFGFHGGSLLAAELALQQPERVAHLVLMDCPAVPLETAIKMLRGALYRLDFAEDLAALDEAWSFSVARKAGQIPLGRRVSDFIDHLQAGAQADWGFRAAFTYDWAARLPELAGPVLVLASESGLKAPTLSAAGVIPGAQLVELPQITQAALDTGAEAIAALLRDNLT